MRAYSLSHLSDSELTHGLTSLVAHDRVTTAGLLAHVAEFDARRLYLPAAFPSMFAYCVHELRLSEDAAYKRIQAARVARQFPVIFEALADGRLHLTGVGLLAPYLRTENAEELMASAAHRTKAEIEELIAKRFPQSESLPLVVALPAAAPRANEERAREESPVAEPPDVTAPSCQLAPAQVGTHTKMTPVAPERFRLELTIGRGTHDKLRCAQELLGHAVPSGDVVQVLDRALDALIAKLERRKLAACKKPRQRVRTSRNPRHIPAHVKRAVWERDGGQCAYVSESRRRCPERKLLELDHLEPVARGGRATVANTRLLCRAHNHHAAECTFGADFMRNKREEARLRAAARRQAAGHRAAEVAGQQAAVRARIAADEIITPLRLLGFRSDEARRAAALCESLADASLEERVRRALSYLRPRSRTVAPAAMSPRSAP